MKHVRLFAALAALVSFVPQLAAREVMHAQAAQSAGLVARHGFGELVVAPHFVVTVTCRDAQGRVKWVDGFRNTVVTAGKNDLLDKYFAGSAYTAAFKLGLKGTGSVVAGDTLASHAGWAEVTPYSGNRPALSWSAASAGSKSATVVSYTINASATVAGAFVTDQATGTTGLLYSAGDFSASRSVISGDTLNVTLSVSA
jgi:hypothetical protein